MSDPVYKTFQPLEQYYLASRGVYSGDEWDTASYSKIPNTPFFTTYAAAEAFFDNAIMASASNRKFYGVKTRGTSESGNFYHDTIVIIRRLDIIPHMPKVVGNNDSYMYAPTVDLLPDVEYQYSPADADQGVKYLIP